MHLEIDKLGGTSVDGMQQSGRVIAGNREPGKALLVITSARSGVTSSLQDTIRVAVKRGVTEEGFSRTTTEEMAKYRELYDEPDVPNYWIVLKENAQQCHVHIDENVDPTEAGPLHKMVKDRTIEAMGDFTTMARAKTLFEPLRDRHCALLGEGITGPTVAAHLRCCGIDAVHYEVAQIMVTDSHFGNASPIITGIRERSRESGLLANLNVGRVVTTGGYYGSDKDGRITTLSRGGSDRSATAIGQALTVWFDSIAVCLYKADKDIAGVMSADPKFVDGAHVLEHMLFEEAGGYTAMGGKVIHPKAVHHAVWSGSSKRPPFPIYVKSTVRPELPGTLIDNQVRPDDPPIQAISVMMNSIRVGIGGWGMDKPGIARKFFGVLAERGIDIDAIIQSTSKLSLDAAFQFGKKVGIERECEEIMRRLREVLKAEIAANDVDKDIVVEPTQLIGIVGRGCQSPESKIKVYKGMLDFPELKKPGAYKMVDGRQYDFSILVNLPDEKRVKALAQSIHDSVFDG